MKVELTLGLALATLLCCTYPSLATTDEGKLTRVRRDTSEWVRSSLSEPLLQDFKNGTVNSITTSVWKICRCGLSGCDCSAEYQDFNSTKLHFKIYHMKTHTRFRVEFRDTNNTINQQFVLVNGTSCFQFRRSPTFDQVCFTRYGFENNTVLEKACVAVGVRIQSYSSVASDFECIKYMDDGTTHVGQINITQPDLNYIANFTLYGAASSTATSTFVILASIVVSIFMSKMQS